MPVSVIILTFNSAATLPQTIAAAKLVSDDIHVVDSFSTDGTVELARAAGATIVQHAFERYDLQRNWAIETLPLKHGWELHLDADERPTPELAAEINRVMADPPVGVEGYMVPRLIHFLNVPIRHGGMYPNWHLRLFRRGKGRCERRLYDQHFLLPGGGRVERLHAPMIDDMRMSLEEWTRRHLRWAEAQAAMAVEGGGEGEIPGRWTGSPIERKRALRRFYGRVPALLRPFLFFFYRYVLRLGFLDGVPGLIFFVLQTFWFHFFVDARIYERRLMERG
jgi:glycosyltransferase involved in cell wall biosynthesis